MQLLRDRGQWKPVTKPVQCSTASHANRRRRRGATDHKDMFAVWPNRPAAEEVAFRALRLQQQQLVMVTVYGGWRMLARIQDDLICCCRQVELSHSVQLMRGPLLHLLWVVGQMLLLLLLLLLLQIQLI